MGDFSMDSIRVTKYNPQYRDTNDVYTREEWTSFSDINKVFQGKLFSLNEYLLVEEKYIKAVKTILKEKNIKNLKIRDLEIYSEDLNLNLKEGDSIGSLNLNEVMKMILRENIWCKLVSDDYFEIHFGYDYYMYFVSNEISNRVIESVKEIEGLFVEKRKSPYIR
jgi:hypothetical protein